jgi:hypothetical protein
MQRKHQRLVSSTWSGLFGNCKFTMCEAVHRYSCSLVGLDRARRLEHLMMLRNPWGFLGDSPLILKYFNIGTPCACSCTNSHPAAYAAYTPAKVRDNPYICIDMDAQRCSSDTSNCSLVSFRFCGNSPLKVWRKPQPLRPQCLNPASSIRCSMPHPRP